MASRFLRLRGPLGKAATALWLVDELRILTVILPLLALFLIPQTATPQVLIKSAEPGQPVTLNPSDLELLESDEPRRDLPCNVTPSKPDLGFDLRFHAGYTVTVPMSELEGAEDMLTVLFRVYPQDNKSHAVYFVQHFRVPAIQEDAKGDVTLGGAIDLGEGNYHVNWLIRDRAERSCSSSWDYQAELPDKDKSMVLFIKAGQIAETIQQPFANDRSAGSGSHADVAHRQTGDGGLSIKLLMNFAPQKQDSAALQRTDTDALVSILKTIQRDPHVARISLVAFNMEAGKIVYRQDTADQINFRALGKSLETVKLGTVDIQHLEQKRSETDFLEDLIQKEVAGTHSDAVIFAGPKAMLNADVPQEDLRRIGDIECPVFYMNYNLNPQAVPWKDSISHAIRAFKGTEYTISRPRDLWFSTSDILERILRSKQQHALLRTLNAGSSR